MDRCPTLVIAGAHSGVGKTSLALALARALARRGLKIQTFKVGPDFLDPTYLALASGRPCYNLDGWMAGREHVCRLFERATADADCALVEGVMGLFDGADAESDAGSTAETARWLNAPVLLVVGVHGMARSLAALVKGFAGFDPELRFRGAIANHAGSERHADWLSDSLKAAGLPPLLGALPRGAFPELTSRHLGLVTADERLLPDAVLDSLADALERHCPLEAFFPEMLAKSISPLSASASGKIGTAPYYYHTTSPAATPADRSRSGKLGKLGTAPYFPPTREKLETTSNFNTNFPADTPVCRPRQEMLFPPLPSIAAGRLGTDRPPARLKIGVAKDAAFHFYYRDLFDALAEAGCETVFFSPLSDRWLPEGISGLYLGGGYPEAHAAALAANAGMLASIREYANSGRPLYAECGGLMYLSEGIEAGGLYYPLLGTLPARTRMLGVKKALGYVEVALTEDSLWGRRGDIFRGHEFHYSELCGDPAADPAWRAVYALRRQRSGAIEAEGFQKGAILASYTHLYYGSRPAAIEHFLNRCGGGS